MATSPATPEKTGVVNTSGLAPWAADYITDYLGKSQALANAPYQVYEGPLTAAASPLQTQAFQGIGALTVPTGLADAAATANAAAAKAGELSYGPTQFQNQFNAPAAYQPAQFTSGFNAPAAYTPSQIASTYRAPAAYKPADFSGVQFTAPGAYTGADFSGIKFNAPQQYQAVGSSFTAPGVAGQYMNPYLQQALAPTLDEIQRRAQISLQPELAKITQAGAYGGSREAILRAEAQKALMSQIADTTGKGYATAYDTAAAQFNAEQARLIQEAQYAAQMGMTSAELAAKYGLEVARAVEQSKQFGATQAMTSADLAAKYALAKAQGVEQSRQFGYGQEMTAAEVAARLDMEAARANEASRQFGSTQAMTGAELAARYGLDVAKASEASRQFGAAQAMDAARLGAQYGLDAERASEASKQFGATYGLDALARQMDAARLQSGLATTMSDIQRTNLDQMLRAGTLQRDIEQAGITADLDEFNRQREFPYKQVQFQRDMISGLPTGSVSSTAAPMDPIQRAIAAAGGVDELLKQSGGMTLGQALENLFGGNLTIGR